jgi:hypothetical protein
MNWLKIKRKNVPIGFYEEKTPEKEDIFSRIETKITLNRQEYYQNILYKFDSGEIDLLYEDKERKGIIMGGSTSGNTIVGILKEKLNDNIDGLYQNN